MTFFRRQTSEKSAYEGLYFRYKHDIFACITRKVENRDDVLDVMQEVCIHLWKSRDKIFSGNAEAIIFNTCKQEISKFYRRTNKKLYSEELFYDLEDSSAQEFKAVKKKEHQLVALEKSIELIIPPLRKTIFKMSKLQGIPHEQIATQLDMSKGAVENQIAKAMIFLKKYHSNC
ncbi:RNA polymerase sigma factor [Chryseobacterium lathyri]|uniref:RNA polymerase sigma factor 70 region 4 type 2 domain-containing protein n=1 Tax=Chryseobacterium lathyri TaxID=395933 RepID=A0A511YEX9_9FLAO|nr:sigma-70 family RNA polymerase sigma factor [Chryseobacterium lathyri]GEN73755.1 hypothetical protein CLA01_38270 [Chryseobacterium lathyri]